MALPVSETWTGSNGDPWPAQWTTSVSGGTGLHDIQSNAGRMRRDTVGGYADWNRANLNVESEADFECYVELTVGAAEDYPGIIFRSDGAWTGNNTPTNGFVFELSVSTTTGELFRMDAGVRTNLGGQLTVSPSYTSGTVKVRIRCVGSNIKIRAWVSTSSEPSTWQWDAADSNHTTRTGFAFEANGGPGTAADTFTWDNLSIVVPSALPIVPTLVQTIGSNTAQATGGSLSVDFAGATKPAVDDWIIVRTGRDNITNDTATGDSISATPGGETYTRTALAQPSGTSTSLAGIVGAMFSGKVVTAWPAGTNTVTWSMPSTVVVAKAVHVEHWTNIGSIRASSAASGGSAAGAPTVTSGTLTSGDVVMGMAAIEGSSTQAVTADADATNGDWSTQFTQVASGASSNATTARTFAKLVGQYKVVTATGTQTYDVTNANTASVDAVAIVVGFVPAAVVGTVSRYIYMPAVQRAAVW